MPQVGAWRGFETTTTITVADHQGTTRLWVPLPDVDTGYQRTLGHDWSGNATEIATVKPAESQQCLDARTNMKRLAGNEAIGIDTNGDGKADRNLSAEERTTQTELNQAAVKAYCPPAK